MDIKGIVSDLDYGKAITIEYGKRTVTPSIQFTQETPRRRFVEDKKSGFLRYKKMRGKALLLMKYFHAIFK